MFWKKSQNNFSRLDFPRKCGITHVASPYGIVLSPVWFFSLSNQIGDGGGLARRDGLRFSRACRAVPRMAKRASFTRRQSVARFFGSTKSGRCRGTAIAIPRRRSLNRKPPRLDGSVVLPCVYSWMLCESLYRQAEPLCFCKVDGDGLDALNRQFIHSCHLFKRSYGEYSRRNYTLYTLKL